MHVRVADASDAECLAQLLRDYLDEGYPEHAGSTAAELRRDVLIPAGRYHVLLIVGDGAPIGFLAWDEVYDMHWALAGAQIADVYVAPSGRGDTHLSGRAFRHFADLCDQPVRHVLRNLPPVEWNHEA